jgi:SSS family solute:Na+ symporter
MFALTSNDIISYITKMISMIMSGLFICTMLGRFWTRFNWQGAVAALLAACWCRLWCWWIATGWLLGQSVYSVGRGSLVSAVLVTLLTPGQQHEPSAGAGNDYPRAGRAAAAAKTAVHTSRRST